MAAASTRASSVSSRVEVAGAGEPLGHLGELGPDAHQLLVDASPLGLRLAVDLAGLRQRRVGVGDRPLREVAVGDRFVGGQLGDVLAAHRARFAGHQLGHERPGPQRDEDPLALGLGGGVGDRGLLDDVGGGDERGLRFGVGHLAPLEGLGQLGQPGVVAALPIEHGSLGEHGERRLGLGHRGNRVGVELGAATAGPVGRGHLGRQLGHTGRGDEAVEQREAVASPRQPRSRPPPPRR